MKRGWLGILVFVLTGLSAVCQNAPANDSLSKKPQNAFLKFFSQTDSTLVEYNNLSFDSIFLGNKHYVDTAVFNASDHDQLSRYSTLFNTLSNAGAAAKAMRYTFNHGVGFDMSIPVYDYYMFNENNMPVFKSVLPYSELRYLMTAVDKEQNFRVRFGMQVRPRFYVSFGFDFDFSPGVYKNNKTNNNDVWVNAHYTIPSGRYAVMAYYFRNKIENQENGGIVYDTVYTTHQERDNGVIITNLTNATNFVVSSGFGFSHYFNLMPNPDRPSRKKDKKHAADTLAMGNDTIVNSLAIDTLALDTLNIALNDTLVLDTLPAIDSADVKKKKWRFSPGRIGHTFAYKRNKMYFNESSPAVEFYAPFGAMLNSTSTADSTIVRSIVNGLRWSNLAYDKYDGDVPLFLFAEASYGFYKISGMHDYATGDMLDARNFSQVAVSGGAEVNLFKSSHLTAKANVVVAGDQVGDFAVDAEWLQLFGTTKKNYGRLEFRFIMKRQSASWFEQSYYSNNFTWDNDFRAATYLSFDAAYRYRTFALGAKHTSINSLIYFGTDARPTQYDGFCSVTEVYASYSYAIKRFEFSGFSSLQFTKADSPIHLPLFMTRLKLAYSQPIFRKAATLQPSITIQYFTKYYADAYMPALRVFYQQNDVKIGNYPFLDLALSIKVKRANIFIEYSNMIMLTPYRESFTTPHYPYRDGRFFFGVNWRLFN